MENTIANKSIAVNSDKSDECDKSDKNQKSTIENSLEMLKVDFEQLTAQVTSFSSERSRFLRVALLIWGAPLLIASAIYKLNGDGVNPETILSTSSVIGFSFILSGLINCIVLSSLVSSRNAINMSTSGINYLRSLYFYELSKNKLVKLDKSARGVIGLEGEKPPVFKSSRSQSTDVMLIIIALVNLIYGSLGYYLVEGSIDDEIKIIATFLGIFIIAAIIVSLYELRLVRILKDKKD